MKIRPEPKAVDPVEVLNAIYRRSIAAFGEGAFAVLEPTRTFSRNLATKALSHLLDRICKGEINRAVLNMPPRTGKSSWASVILPALLHALNPNLRIICVSYSSELAAKHARDYRTLITSPWYKKLSPGTRIDPAKNSESEISLIGGGFRLASSVRGTLTGRGGDIIIIDDSMRADDALSDAKRKTPKDWFDGTLLSRLDNKEEGVILIAEQRLHEDDLSAYVLAKGGWEHLCLPAIAEVDAEIPIGPGEVYKRKAGEVLMPDREPLEVLEALKKQMGAMLFAAQYQQNPVPVEGNIIKGEWFIKFDELPPSVRPWDRVIQSWDPASSPGVKSDYHACVTVARRGKRHYIVHVLRVRADYPDFLKLVISHRIGMGADIVLMENTALGKAVIQDIAKMPHVQNLVSITPREDKATRMAACSALIETGDVYLPNDADWLQTFRAELLQFPGGAHDDQVDALSQYLNWAKKNPRTDNVPAPSEGPDGSNGGASRYPDIAYGYCISLSGNDGPQFYVPKRHIY
jgi:predicted phage terminase large subunit-like protein